jgi:hypothetical protein
MEYVLIAVEQTNNIRSYAFAEIDRDLPPFTVVADISLLRECAIPLQEPPMLCRHFLEEQREAGSDQILTYEVAEMLQSARRPCRCRPCHEGAESSTQAKSQSPGEAQ